MADRREKAVATANTYNQGNIAGLDDAMTRRLVASTVATESNGGDLAITNKQGYTGRYQAGAGWLADAGYVDKDKLKAAMSGYKSEWAWASKGHMTEFLKDPSNWKNGLSLEQYKQSPELQDKAFKINSDNAYRQAMKQGVLHEGDDPAKVAGFLKARHIAGYGGAMAAVTGGRVIRDSNGTSNYDYMHDITRNRDGLDKMMGRDPKVLSSTHLEKQTPSREEPSRSATDGALKQGEKGAGVRAVQEQLARLGYTDAKQHAIKPDGDFGPNTKNAVAAFQHAHGLKEDGIVGKHTLAALAQAQQHPLVSEATHPDNKLFQALKDKMPGVDDAHVAETLRAAKDAGITNPAKLQSVMLHEGNAFVMGTEPGSRAKVDLNGPVPSLQETSQQLDSQSKQPLATQEQTQSALMR